MYETSRSLAGSLPHIGKNQFWPIWQSLCEEEEALGRAAIFNSIGTKSVTLLQNADCTWILFLSLEAKGENNIRDYSSEIIKGYD